MGSRHFSLIPSSVIGSFLRFPASASPFKIRSFQIVVRLFTNSTSWHARKEVDDRVPMTSKEKDSAWCIIDFDDKIFQARVVHIGRGKYLILKDNQSDEYVDRIVDASDILSCDPKN